MSLKDEIKYSLDFLNSNREEILEQLPAFFTRNTFESLHHSCLSVLEKNYDCDGRFLDNVAYAFIADNLWNQLSESNFDLIVDGISYDTFFREISIYIISTKNIDTKDFCRYLINVYLRTPKRFLFSNNQNYEIIWDNESNVKSILSMLYDTSSQYSEMDFTPLRLLVTLVPNDITYLAYLCQSCRCPFLQYYLCYDFISEVMDVFPQTGSQLIEKFLVRRHLLCPLFATRFVSAFFFRARGGAAARRDGGLKEGGAVYAVSARGPVAAVVFLETFLQDASGSRRTAVASGLRGGWRRRMSTLV